MSHTVIVDEGERSRQFENQINKAVRHCKVRVKRWKYVWPSRPFPPVIHPSPFDGWKPGPAGAPSYPLQWWQSPIVC